MMPPELWPIRVTLPVAEAAAKGEAPPKRDKRKDPTNPRNFKPAAPGALILCPTRELAQQIHGVFEQLGKASHVGAAVVVGGFDLGTLAGRPLERPHRAGPRRRHGRVALARGLGQ